MDLLPKFESMDALVEKLQQQQQDQEEESTWSSTSRRGYLRSPVFRKKVTWLSCYFCFNLLLTLHNKFTMVAFPYPYILTGIHAFCNCVGTITLLVNGSFKLTRLNWKDSVAICAFSILYSFNIAASNLSLEYVTVPVHQVIRSLTPLMVVIITLVALKGRFSRGVYYSLCLVSCGVGLATFGDYDFNSYGLMLTLLGAFLAAVKTVVTTSILKTSSKLSPLDLLFYLSPLACLHMCIAAGISGETTRFLANMQSQSSLSYGLYVNLALNGAIAFGLNVVSFNANKNTGAVAISVAANVKQITTIVLAVFCFNLHIKPLNGAGIVLTLVGGAWYAYIEFQKKKSTPHHISPPTTPVATSSQFFHDMESAREKVSQA